MTASTQAQSQNSKLYKFGRWFITPFFAIGSGMITTVAVSGLSWVAALALPGLIPLLTLIFLAETAVSVYLFKNSVPETLISVFGTKDIFKNLSRNKKILLGLGMFSALGGGLALGALTYTSGVAAVGAVLGLCSLAFPPVGIAVAGALALVGFIAYSSLLIKWIANAVKNDIHKKVANFFVKIFTRDPEKPLAQQVLEGTFKLLFTASIVAVTIVGTIATLGTMQKGLTAFFSLIPQANQLACKIAAGIVAFGLMGVARLPWAAQAVCSVFSKMGAFVGRCLYRAGAAVASACGFKPTPVSKPKVPMDKSPKSILSSFAKITAVLIHSFSFGALAKSGGAAVIKDIAIDAHITSSPEVAADLGQTASVVAGGLMSGGIGAFTLFAKLPKPAPEVKKEEEQPKPEPVVKL